MILTKIKHIFIPDFNYANDFFLVYIYLLMYVRSASIYKGVCHWHEGLFGVIIFYIESSFFFYLKTYIVTYKYDFFHCPK